MKIERWAPVFLAMGVLALMVGCGGNSSNNSGGSSGSSSAPTISSISPTSATAGSGPLTLTVTGTGFVSTTSVAVGGVDDATTYVSSTQVTTTVEPAQLASGGTLSVVASNGSAASAGVSLTVNNPSPAITALLPSSLSTAATSLVISVTGTGFVPATVINVNGSARTTAYVGATQLNVQLNASDVAAAGSLSLTAVNGTPGGGTSTAATLAVVSSTSGLPAVSSISPATVTAGSGPLTLTVTGTGFTPATTVAVGGVDDATTYVSSMQLTATVEAAQLATGGTLSVIASNAVGASGAVNLTVNNPAPTIATLLPSSLYVATTNLSVTVAGTGFVPATVIDVNGSARTTTYVSGTQATVQLNASDVNSGGTLSLTAVNAAPGGGTSAAATISVTNPIPAITKLSPNYAVAGATSPVTITITGLNFDPATTIQVNGSARATTYVSTTQVTFQLTVSDMASPQTATVMAVNPAPGGGNSFVAQFGIFAQTGQPVISQVQPSQFIAGSGSTTITISGTNLFPTINLSTSAFEIFPSTVQWNGTALTVEGYGSSSSTFGLAGETIIAAVPASLIASTGTASITVTSPIASPTTSAPVTVSITNAPAPTLTSIYPASGPVNTATAVTLTGTGFTSGSTVAVNGITIPSTYVTSSEITTTIPASSVAMPGNESVTVTTPSPGGGTTSSLPFTAYVGITSNDVVYNATTGLFYASVPGSASSYGNSVVAIDPATGNVVQQIWVGSNPNKLALSSDGTQLFVGLDGANSVAQVNLSTATVVNQFSLVNSVVYAPYTATAMAAVPGLPNSVAVTISNDVVVVYDSGVARTKTSGSFINSSGPLSFGSSSTTLYTWSGSGVEMLTVGANGITAATNIASAGSSYSYTGSNIQYDSGNLYLSNGTVLNATTGALEGTLYASASTVATGPIVSDSTLGLAFVANGTSISGSPAVYAFNESTFNTTGSIPVSGVNASYPYTFEKILRWGQDGLAVNTGSQIFIIQSPVVQSLSSSPADLSVTLAAPSTATTGTAITYTATVNNGGPNQALDATLALALDSSLIVNSITPSQGSCGTGTSFSCNLGTMANGASATVTVSATPTTAATIAGSTTVISVSYDPATTNNQATTSTTVTGSFYAMSPMLSGISPQLVQAGSGAFTLTVTGNGFNSDSTVNLNGTALTTSYVSSTQLTANVTASQIANYGWAAITVSNPSPGGGTSQIAPLTIYDLVNVTPNNILYEPFTQQLYATVPAASTSVTGDSIVAINPATGAVGTPIPVGSQPTVMAETSDGNYLYVGLQGSDSLVKVNLLTQAVAATIPLTVTQYGSTNSVYATSLSAMPGSDTTLAIGTSGTYSVLGIYDVSGSTGAFRANTESSTSTSVFADPTHVYEANSNTFYRYSVSATGLSQIDATTLNGFGSYPASFNLAGGLVYGGAGGIINPSTTPPAQIATMFLPEFYESGITEIGAGAVADPSTQKDFVMEENAAGTWEYGLARFNTTNYLAENVLVMPASASSIETTWLMVRWGQAGLALLSVPDGAVSPGTTAQLILLEGPFVTPQLLGTNTAATLASSSVTSVTHGAGNTIITVTGTNLAPGVAITWNGNYRTTTWVSATQATVDIPASDLTSTGSGSLVATNPGGSASNALTVTIN